jgi:hypothetical protein
MSETMEHLDSLHLKILNNTGEDLVLQAERIEKGKFKKGHQAPAKIESYEEKELELVACEGSCEGGADIEGWIKYGAECQGGSCKIHFKYTGKTDQLTYSCECQIPSGKMLCEIDKDKNNKRVISWMIGPKV